VVKNAGMPLVEFSQPERIAELLVHHLLRLDHVGVAVRDIEAGIDAWAERTGGVVTHREVNEEQGVEEAMMSMPDETFELQILAPLSPDSTIAKFIEKHGEVTQQIAYEVDDLDATVATLKAHGITPIYASAKTGTRNSRINFIHPRDADGVLIELLEY
jgi:methylmalonyl-CoA/ethylmalonyl-CoA epimerase